jgi:hypothetical protein
MGRIGDERADDGCGQQQRNAHDEPPDVTSPRQDRPPVFAKSSWGKTKASMLRRD